MLTGPRSGSYRGRRCQLSTTAPGLTKAFLASSAPSPVTFTETEACRRFITPSIATGEGIVRRKIGTSPTAVIKGRKGYGQLVRFLSDVEAIQLLNYIRRRVRF